MKIYFSVVLPRFQSSQLSWQKAQQETIRSAPGLYEISLRALNCAIYNNRIQALNVTHLSGGVNTSAASRGPCGNFSNGSRLTVSTTRATTMFQFTFVLCMCPGNGRGAANVHVITFSMIHVNYYTRNQSFQSYQSHRLTAQTTFRKHRWSASQSYGPSHDIKSIKHDCKLKTGAMLCYILGTQVYSVMAMWNCCREC